MLSQEFYHMPRERRESMLHTSAGHRAVSAYVEIFFNNEERRIPVISSPITFVVSLEKFWLRIGSEVFCLRNFASCYTISLLLATSKTIE